MEVHSPDSPPPSPLCTAVAHSTPLGRCASFIVNESLFCLHSIPVTPLRGVSWRVAVRRVHSLQGEYLSAMHPNWLAVGNNVSLLRQGKSYDPLEMAWT